MIDDMADEKADDIGTVRSQLIGTGLRELMHDEVSIDRLTSMMEPGEKIVSMHGEGPYVKIVISHGNEDEERINVYSDCMCSRILLDYSQINNNRKV